MAFLKVFFRTFLVAQTVKRLSTMRETRVRFLGREDPLEKEMAIHSSTIAWKIPWTEEPGRPQSIGVTKSRTQLSNFTFTICLSRFVQSRRPPGSKEEFQLESNITIQHKFHGEDFGQTCMAHTEDGKSLRRFSNHIPQVLITYPGSPRVCSLVVQREKKQVQHIWPPDAKN